jgi:hypothetical protein
LGWVGLGWVGLGLEENKSWTPTVWRIQWPADITKIVVSSANPATSEKESTRISPFLHPNVHVITCSSFIWLEIHASMDKSTWFLYVRTPLATDSHNLFPRVQINTPHSPLFLAN